MTPPLRREILTPTHAHALRILASGLGAGLIATGLLLGLRAHVVTPVAPPVELNATESVHVPFEVAVADVPPEVPPSDEVALVFHAGGAAYMKLADVSGHDAEIMPRHGAPTRSLEEYVETVIAPVAADDVPRAYRAWLERTVSVDGTCHTRVAGFAVVARLTGDPGYAGESHQDWTPSSILAHGAPVLAARLEGCVGAGTVARDAASARIVVPDVTEDPALATAGRELVLASEEAQQAKREWEELGHEGAWQDSPDTEWLAYVVRHPTTGARYVSVEATHFVGCGGPEIQLWQLFRIGPAGQLERVEVSAGALTSIDQLIDIDGDGTFEVLGRPWPGGATYLVDASGEAIAQLDLPFYGCSC